MALNMQTLILSSSSKGRIRLLNQLKIPFEIFHPDVDETCQDAETALHLVRRLARAKAIAASPHFANALIIGGDQVAVVDGRILGKPRDHGDAVKMLNAINGKTVIFLAGICLYNNSSKRAQIQTDKFKVIFRKFNDQSIQNYLDRENPYDCAGCVKLEGPGIALIEAIYSRDPSSLLGLPLIKLTRMLEHEGVSVL